MFIQKNGKKFFKGNLHMHTNLSDGVLSPEEALDIYKKDGYDFVALTDHWHFGNDFRHDGMLVLSGCECNISKRSAKNGIVHILAIGYDKVPDVTKNDSAQKIIDGIHAAGGLACLAHPAWSLNAPDKIAELSGIDFTEIFNSVSDMPKNARPYSGLILDILALRDIYLPLAATDDTHFYEKYDTCRSFCLVEAEECTKESIMASLAEGKYYASQGPVLDVSYDGEKVSVDCSPVDEIVYFSDFSWSGHRADVGCGLTHGEFVPNGESFVRIEVKDKEGRYAWSQYIKL